MDDSVYENCPEDPTKEDGINCLDAWSHQTLRVKKSIIHNNYRNQDNDLALLQLHPTGDDGLCARFDDYVQPACLNKDASRFPAGLSPFYTISIRSASSFVKEPTVLPLDGVM